MWKSICFGIAGGLAGAWAMNGFQALVTKASGGGVPSEDEDATVKTARAISRTVFHRELTKPQTQWAGPLVHYGMGSGLGAVYGLLADAFPAVTAGYGLVYGAAAWIVADEVMVPVLGFAKGPAETEWTSHANALASHLVFGAATDLTRRSLRKLVDSAGC